MDQKIKSFVMALELFTKEADLMKVVALFPEDMNKRKVFYFKEMFITPENHLFYIVTSLFIDWAAEFSGQCDDKISIFLDEIKDIFEFIDTDISLAEQQKVIDEVKVCLGSLSIPVRHLTKSEIQSLRESKRDAYYKMMAMN